MGDNKYIHNFGGRILQLTATWEFEKKNTGYFGENVCLHLQDRSSWIQSTHSQGIFYTVHFNIKFPSKPKSLWTFSERTLSSFGKRSWVPNRHTKLYSTTANSGSAVGEEDHYFCTVRKWSDEWNHWGDFNTPDAAEKQATTMPVINSSTESRNY
jgi:hypothetical protein